MHTQNIIIVSLMANALSACSSPPKLSEPTGEWISFEPVMSQPATKINESVHVDYVAPLTPLAKPTPVIQTDNSKVSLVLSDGKKTPLYKAVRGIVPSSWNVVLSPPVSQSFKDLVSWTGNDQWPFVLRKMLVSHNLEAQIDDKLKQVVIVYGKAPLIASPVPVNPVVDKPVNKTTASKPASPFSGSLVPTGVSPVPVQPSVTQPVQAWSIDKGITLKEGIMGWAAREKCTAAGSTNWTVLWNTPVNYRVDAPLQFGGDFKTALNDVFALYQHAEKPLYAVTNSPQCLIRIGDK